MYDEEVLCGLRAFYVRRDGLPREIHHRLRQDKNHLLSFRYECIRLPIEREVLQALLLREKFYSGTTGVVPRLLILLPGVPEADNNERHVAMVPKNLRENIWRVQCSACLILGKVF